MASTPELHHTQSTETYTHPDLASGRGRIAHHGRRPYAWLDAAGLVPYYPHAQFSAAPQPSFAEAILGRPETGWIASTARVNSGDSGEESYAVEVEDEEPEEGDENEDLDDDSEEDEDEELEGDDEGFDDEDDEESEDEGEESEDDEDDDEVEAVSSRSFGSR